MKKGSFILGLGIGVFAMSMVFLLLGNALRGSFGQARHNLEMEIYSLVQELALLEDQLDSFGSGEIAVDDQQIIARAQLLGMVFAQAPEEYDYNTAHEQPYEETLYNHEPTNVGDVNIDDYNNTDQYEESGTSYIPAAGPQAVEALAGSAGTDVSITITPGTSLNGISELLLAHGVVDDAIAFTSYVQQNNAGTLLQAGDFVFRRGVGMNETLGVLLGRR